MLRPFLVQNDHQLCVGLAHMRLVHQLPWADSNVAQAHGKEGNKGLVNPG